MKREIYERQKKEAWNYFERAGIVVTPEEKERIEVADFGLNRIEETGLQLLTYINTDRVCAKEMVLMPGQACPEHRHPNCGGQPGKEETFRCRYGKVFLYVEGERMQVTGPIPEGVYTVFHEVVLLPGQQYTIQPDTLHWFKAGAEGAVISEFSTRSCDETDVFSDPAIVRIPVMEG